MLPAQKGRAPTLKVARAPVGCHPLKELDATIHQAECAPLERPFFMRSRSACTIASRLRALRRVGPSIAWTMRGLGWTVRAGGIELEQLLRKELECLGL